MGRPYASLGPRAQITGMKVIDRQLIAERQYSIIEAATILHMSRSYVHRACADGALRCVRYGNRIRILESDLEDFIRRSLEAS